MLKIEKSYKAEALFTKNQDNTWDKKRDEEIKITLFGLVLFKKSKHLDIDYKNIVAKKIGYDTD